MEFGEEIGKGNYRFCYAIKDSDLSVKINRKFVIKKIAGFNVYFPAFIFSFLKFGTMNPNKKEYEILANLPKKLRKYLPEHIAYRDGLLIQSRPKNYDGSYSASVYHSKEVKNELFWEHVKKIEAILLEHQIYPLDIFRGGGNVMIQKINEMEWIPIIIDFKRIGYRPIADSLDFKLMFKSQQKKKFLQRMEAFVNQYKKV